MRLKYRKHIRKREREREKKRKIMKINNTQYLIVINCNNVLNIKTKLNYKKIFIIYYDTNVKFL